MKTAVLTIVMVLATLGLWAQEQDQFLDILKQEMNKKEARESLINSAYWQSANQFLQKFAHTGVGIIQTFDTRYEGVKGSPYLFPEWQKGAVIVSGMDQAMPLLLNYDCVNGQLLVRMADGEPSSLSPSHINAFMIEDSEAPEGYAYFVSDLGPKGEKIYFQVLYNEESVLYKLPVKHFKAADYQKAYSPNRRYDEFVSDIQYFIKKGDGQPEKVKTNAKAVAGMFADKAPEIEGFIKKNKLKLKTDEELTQVVSYYDSL